MAAINLNAVRKSFGDIETIHGVDIDIQDGEFVVFVGPSGCGKSTLLRLVAGLEDITAGELQIGNKVVNELPPPDRGVAMVFQSYALYPHMTVYENMAFGLKLAHKSKEEIKQRVINAARILQMEHLLDRKPKELSGGQRQRVAIGRAIVREPQVFLFDEPLSNLDAALRIQMRMEISKLHNDLKTTMVYVTHDQIEAMTMANKIVVLRDGYVEQIGAPLELYHHPTNLFVAGFIGSPQMNFIAGELAEIDEHYAMVRIGNSTTVKADVDATRGNVGDKVTLGIRPEHYIQNGTNVSTITGQVLVVEQLGDSTLIHMTVEDLGNNLVVRLAGNRFFKVGDTLNIGLPENACHLFDSDGMAFKRVVDPLEATPDALRDAAVQH